MAVYSDRPSSTTGNAPTVSANTPSAAPQSANTPATNRTVRTAHNNKNVLTNLPSKKEVSPTDATIQYFDGFYVKPYEFAVGDHDAVKGFFNGNGFTDEAADSITFSILKQAQNDGVNPQQVLDALRKTNPVLLTELVAEIMNTNRANTSFIGFKKDRASDNFAKRNIID
tara:strand:- start:15441 stop:15950 length:510 start_codon:yes stop_codon:yes gene_type:complete